MLKRYILSLLALIIAGMGSAIAAVTTVFEGSHEIVNYNSTPLKVDKSMFTTVDEGNILTVYFTVGSAQNYGTIDLCYGATKMACSKTKTNAKPDGNFAATATETSATITEQTDIEGLKSKGLQIKGKNVTITKITLSGSGEGPTDPENPTDPEEPTDPIEGAIWTGLTATGNWANDVTVDAEKFQDAAGGYYLTIYEKVTDGAEYGNIELDDQNYTALSCDKTSEDLDAYGCVQPGVTKLTYRLTNGDVELLKANGLRVKGSNLIITAVALTYGEPVEDEPEPDGIKTLWRGNVNCGKWANSVNVDAAEFADANVGDQLIVDVTKNSGKSYCQPEARDQQDTKLPCSDKGENIESNGYLAAGAKTATYTLGEEDLRLLKANGLKYTGFACTISKIQLKKNEIPSGVEEIEDIDANVEYYNLQGVKVSNPGSGIFIVRKGKNISKVILN